MRDEYKILISFKNSANDSYNEVRKKIDSIVVPLGLEYIYDLQPKIYFMSIFKYCDQELTEECYDNVFGRPIASHINEDLPLKEALKEKYYQESDYGNGIVDKFNFFWGWCQKHN